MDSMNAMILKREEGYEQLKLIVKIMGVLVLLLVMGACGTDTKLTNDEYHLPILEGWKENELTKEKIGNGTIDLWKARFSYEGDINVQLEQYISALKDMGFEVELEIDEEFLKDLQFSKEEKGNKHFGAATIHNDQVQTTSQIMPSK